MYLMSFLFCLSARLSRAFLAFFTPLIVASWIATSPRCALTSSGYESIRKDAWGWLAWCSGAISRSACRGFVAERTPQCPPCSRWVFARGPLHSTSASCYFAPYPCAASLVLLTTSPHPLPPAWASPKPCFGNILSIGGRLALLLNTMTIGREKGVLFNPIGREDI